MIVKLILPRRTPHRAKLAYWKRNWRFAKKLFGIAITTICHRLQPQMHIIFSKYNPKRDNLKEAQQNREACATTILFSLAPHYEYYRVVT